MTEAAFMEVRKARAGRKPLGAHLLQIYPTPLPALRASTRNKYFVMYPYTSRYRLGPILAYDSGFPRRTLLGSLVNKDRRMGQSLSHEQDICPHYCMRLRPYTEAGSSLRDALIMPDKPVALADFCSGLSMLVLTYLS